ncbi:MAG: hypothetical protein RRY29_10105 [Desulfovibrionaceae bacterium]
MRAWKLGIHKVQECKSAFRCVVLIFGLVFLAASVLATVNDLATHTASFSMKHSQDANAVEHLSAHDDLNALSDVITYAPQCSARPTFSAPESFPVYLSLLEYSIEHPPRLFPL